MANRKLRVQQTISAILFVAVIGLLGWLSNLYSVDLDWTANARNSLTEASLKQLGNLKGPVKATAFVPANGDDKQLVSRFFDRYHKAKPDFALKYVDPAKNPTLARDLGISAVGDTVLEYQGRKEIIHNGAANEAEVTRALQRLSFADERWVLFIAGHGEHALDDPTTPGYAAFAKLLSENGLKTRAHNLASSPKIPDNAAAVVVAGPTKPMLEGEVKVLLDYVAAGGHLLWAGDPDGAAPPPALMQALGVKVLPGTAIFPEFAAMGGDPRLFVATGYPATPVTQGLRENALLAMVGALGKAPNPSEKNPFTAQPFLQTSAEAWLETGPLTEELGFDEGKDTKGPLTLGFLLTRNPEGPHALPTNPEEKPKPEKQQRVAVVMDSDFLANPLIAQAGNTELGLNLLRWIASRDDQLDITVPSAPDQTLNLPPWAAIVLEIGFLAVLPVIFLAIGIGRWLRRRRR